MTQFTNSQPNEFLSVVQLQRTQATKAATISSKNKRKQNQSTFSLSRSPFFHSEQQSSSISMPIHERQTPNSKHYHYWSPLRPYSHHRALSLTQASLLGHIVKGHHQHNRHAVATKTDVKLKKKREEKKRNQTKTKL